MVGGSALLFNSKHCKHTALFAQAINLVAWSSIENAYGALSHTYARLADAAASLPDHDLAEASALLDSAKVQLTTARRSLAAATAQWRNGTLDKAEFARLASEEKAAIAKLAAEVATADATLSFLGAAAAIVDPAELYATLSTPLAAVASALALSTSAPAAAVLHGCPLGAGASRMLLHQMSHALGYMSASIGIEEAMAPMAPQRRRWARAALDAAAAFVGYTLARQAKAAAATLSAASLGASGLVSAARGLGADAVVRDAVEAGCAQLPALGVLWPSLLEGMVPAQEAEGAGGDGAWSVWLESCWEQVHLALVVMGVLYQLGSSERLPLPVRVFIWPLLLLEGWLASLSASEATPLRRGASAPPAPGAAGAAAASTYAVDGTRGARHSASSQSGAGKEGRGGRAVSSPARMRDKSE